MGFRAAARCCCYGFVVYCQLSCSATKALGLGITGLYFPGFGFSGCGVQGSLNPITLHPKTLIHTWVVVEIRVPFWVPIIIRRLIFN